MRSRRISVIFGLTDPGIIALSLLGSPFLICFLGLHHVLSPERTLDPILVFCNTLIFPRRNAILFYHKLRRPKYSRNVLCFSFCHHLLFFTRTLITEVIITKSQCITPSTYSNRTNFRFHRLYAKKWEENKRRKILVANSSINFFPVCVSRHKKLFLCRPVASTCVFKEAVQNEKTCRRTRLGVKGFWTLGRNTELWAENIYGSTRIIKTGR